MAFELPSNPRNTADSFWLEDERDAVRGEASRLQMHIELQYGQLDKTLVDKMGAVIAHGHAYAHQVGMLRACSSNTEATRAEAKRARRAWTDVREGLRSAGPGRMVQKLLAETDQARNKATDRYRADGRAHP
ncbi:MAG: hypothetical protein GEV07_11070 [Streptosporangiales bacterium]|nr:hypothetical protein [Streptosporangiales bacterium]